MELDTNSLKLTGYSITYNRETYQLVDDGLTILIYDNAWKCPANSASVYYWCGYRLCFLQNKSNVLQKEEGIISKIITGVLTTILTVYFVLLFVLLKNLIVFHLSKYVYRFTSFSKNKFNF
mgnify:CR=1 FL=1